MASGTRSAREKRSDSSSLSQREQNKLDKLHRIRRAALELFVSEGYDATTIASVAERAEVAKGTVFLYASDKDDLLCMVMHDRLSSTVETQLATVPRKAGLADQLLHVFRGLYRMYGEHPQLALCFIRVLPGAKGPNGQKVAALTFSFQHQLAALVREAGERGEIARDVPHMLAAHNFFALYFGALTGWLNGYVPSWEQALDPLLRSSLELQIRGLQR